MITFSLHPTQNQSQGAMKAAIKRKTLLQEARAAYAQSDIETSEQKFAEADALEEKASGLSVEDSYTLALCH